MNDEKSVIEPDAALDEAAAHEGDLEERHRRLLVGVEVARNGA